jgi:DNA-binding MurR/RpiR family transcriptional regulator
MMTTKKTMNDLKTPGIASEGAQEPSQDLHATPLPLHPFIARLMDLQAVASPQHRQVLEVLLKDPFHGAMWGVEEMAAKAGTSVTSVVRMAKLLGFPAFTEFRQALKQAVEVRVESLERKTLEVSGTEENMLSEVVQRDGQHLQLLLQDITQARMEAVVERIRTARQRLVFGLGSAGIMAEVLAHQLTQAGCTAHAPSGPMYGSMVANLREEDLLIVVSMSPYHRETSEAARFSKERGVPVIVFADSMESPDVRFGDPVLRIPGEDLLTGASLAPFVMLGHALAMVALGRDEAALAERRKAAERISGAFTMERRRSGAWQGPYPPARKP